MMEQLLHLRDILEKEIQTADGGRQRQDMLEGSDPRGDTRKEFGRRSHCSLILTALLKLMKL